MVYFYPLGNTPFSVATQFLQPFPLYSLFCLCSHTRGFRSKHEISMAGTQTAGAFMFLTFCTCICCLFSSLALLKRWSHEVVHADWLAHVLWSWRFADVCCGDSVLKSWNCTNTRVLIHTLLVQINHLNNNLLCKIRDAPQCFFDSTQFLNTMRTEVCLTSLPVLPLKQAMGDRCWT